MPKAVGLAETKRELEAIFVRNVAKLSKVMRAGQYATMADDNGAIGAWIDDAGKYRCEAMRRLQTIDSHIFATFKEVKTWYADWLKKIA